MDGTFASLLLKIVIPSQKTTKTIRIDSKTKIWELQESVKKKMSAASQLPSDVDSFGMFWYSDSGPLWLSDNSTLKSYNMKNGDSLEFKKRPANLTRATVQLSTGTESVTPMPATLLPRETPQHKTINKARQTIDTLKSKKGHSGSASSLLEPTRSLGSGSVYDITPVNLPKATSLSSFSTPSPSFNPNSLTSPTLLPARNTAPPAPTSFPLPTPEASPSVGIADLDVLIESFDDLDVYDDKWSLDSAVQQQGAQYDSDDNNNDNGSLSFNLSRTGSNTLTGSVGSDKEYEQESIVETAQSTTATTSSEASEKAYQKAIEEKVNFRVVERLLVDALGGIESGEDMTYVKMYLSSALTILRSLS